MQRPLSVGLCSRCGGGSPASPSPSLPLSIVKHVIFFPNIPRTQNERKAAPVSLFFVKQNIDHATKFIRKCDNCYLNIRPDLHLQISRLTVLKRCIEDGISLRCNLSFPLAKFTLSNRIKLQVSVLS